MFKYIHVEVLETKLHQFEKFTEALKKMTPHPPTPHLLVESRWDIFGSGMNQGYTL